MTLLESELNALRQPATRPVVLIRLLGNGRLTSGYYASVTIAMFALADASSKDVRRFWRQSGDAWVTSDGDYVIEPASKGSK